MSDGTACKYGGPSYPIVTMYGGHPGPTVAYGGCPEFPRPWTTPETDGLQKLLEKIAPPVLTEARVREIAREEIKAALHEALSDIRAKLGALRDILRRQKGAP